MIPMAPAASSLICGNIVPPIVLRPSHAALRNPVRLGYESLGLFVHRRHQHRLRLARFLDGGVVN